MLVTFKETFQSVTDRSYGSQIAKRSLASVVWYFGQYLLLFSTIPLIATILLATYFVPQSSALAAKHLPEGFVGLTNHVLTTSFSPFDFSSSEGTVKFDPQAPLPADLSDLPTGLYIYQDGLVLSEADGSLRIYRYTAIPDFYVDKSQVVSWLARSTGRLWLFVVLLALLLWAVITGFVFTYYIFTFIFWAFIFWLAGTVLHRSLNFSQSLKIAMYAAVPSLVISAILVIAPNPYISYISLGLFLFLSLSWIWYLPAHK